MAHLIVPHRNGPDNDAEFRYCLRTIDVNLHDPVPHTLTVVGDCPAWLAPDQHIPVSWEKPDNDGKVAEIRSFVRLACAATSGEKEVLYIDDDYFLLEPTETVLPIYGDSLVDHRQRIVARNRSTFWLAKAHAATIAFLSPGATSWELHRPLPVNPSDALKVLPTDNRPLLWRSLYGNLCEPVRTAYQGADGKLGSRIPLGVTWLSSSFRAWQRSLKPAVVNAFTTPSRWEK